MVPLQAHLAQVAQVVVFQGEQEAVAVYLGMEHIPDRTEQIMEEQEVTAERQVAHLERQVEREILQGPIMYQA